MNVGLFFIVPALVILYWVIRVLTKKGILLQAQIYNACSWLPLGFMCVINVLHSYPEYETNFCLCMLSASIGSLFAPLYFLYIRELTDLKGIRVEDFLHFLPWVVLFPSYIFLLMGVPEDLRNQMAHNLMYGEELVGIEPHMASIAKFAYCTYLVLPVHAFIAIVYGTTRRIAYAKLITEYYASNEVKPFMLQKRMFAIYILPPFLTGLIIMMPLMKVFPDYLIVIIALVTAFHFYFIGEKMYVLRVSASLLRQLLKKELIETNEVVEVADGESQKSEPIHKALDNILTEAESLWTPKPSPTELLPADTLRRIREEKLFADPNLNLISLATVLGANRTAITKAIHFHFNTNFADHIRNLRIDYALQLMSGAESGNYNLAEIASMSGYSSIALFYRDFTKKMGCTPKQYIQQQNEKQ